MGLGAKEIVVPDAKESKYHRKVLVQWCVTEVFIHLVRAGQQLLKVFHPNVNRDGQADRRPQRVAASNPIPELKHVLRINAEFRYLLCICRERNKVLGN